MEVFLVVAVLAERAEGATASTFRLLPFEPTNFDLSLRVFPLYVLLRSLFSSKTLVCAVVDCQF